MSVDWALVKLSEILEITSSKRVMRADYVEFGVPFFRSKEIIERSKGNEITTELFITDERFQSIYEKFGAPKEGDILLTSVGTLGVPYQVKEGDRFYFKDGNLTWFRNFSELINPSFLYYWLISPTAKRKLDEVSIGSTQKALTIAALKSLEINLPPIDFQNYVVRVLDSLNGRLAINRQTNQTLEAIAQAIFKSWFVDFEPVKAKMAVLEAGGTAEEAERAARCAISGKDEAALTQLQTEQPDAYAELAQTAALFPSAMQDSELGDMPEGWNIHKFSKFALNVRESVKAENTKDHEIYIGLEHIDRVSLTLSRWGSGGDIESNKSAFIKGDVLFGKLRPYFHKVAIAPINGICSTDILVIRPKRSFYSAFVILQTFNSNFVEHANRRSTGTRMPRASWNDMADYVIASPDNDDIFLKFDERVNPLLNSLSVRNSESITLAELRDTLLPKLLSGEIDLSQAADMADEVSA